MLCTDAAKKLIWELYPSGREFYLSEGMKRFFCEKRSEHKYMCIFGAGVWGTTLYRWLKSRGIQVDFFCDNFKRGDGQSFMGVPLIEYTDLEKIKEDTYIIVSVSNKGAGQKYNDQINRQLDGFPYVMPNILRFCGFYTNDYALSMDQCVSAAERIMGALADERSRQLFMDMLHFKFVSDAAPIRDNPLEKYYDPIQYFSEKYYNNTRDAVIVDCGAFKGDTLLQYVGRFGGVFRKYHCFEMDGQAFDAMEKNVQTLPDEIRDRVVLYQCGVFSEHRQAYYNASTDTLASTIIEDGQLRTELAALDEMFLDDPVTMINMDIEGSELPALTGAEQTILKWHPILAVSIYHSTEQFFSVPKYIIDHFPFYDFYLGLHTTVTDDCVFYAIPR